MSRFKIKIDKNELKYLYVDKKLSMAKIAGLFDTNAVTIYNRLHDYNIFIRTVSEALKGRISWNKGKKLSEETIRKLGKISKKRWSNPAFRKKMEARDKISSERMKGENNPMRNLEARKKRSEKMIGKLLGNKNPAKKLKVRRKISKALRGHRISLESREKIRKNLVGRYGGDKNPFFGKHHTDEVKEKSRKRAIRQLVSGEFKNKATSIELKIEEELIRRNIFYKKQFPLIKMTVADFYLPRRKIVIYADGEFWHRSEWAKMHGVIEKDKKQNEILKNNGYKVFRFFEPEINNSVSDCINMVANYINSVKV